MAAPPASISWFENTAEQLRNAFPVLATNQGGTWKPLTLDWRIIVGTFVAFIGATLSNSAGIGGGGLFVPLFRLLIGFDVKTSAALSKSMIMGGAIASALHNLRLKHPILDKPLIDYDIALLIQPMLLLGISFGVMCNVVFPDWALTVLLVIVLIAMSYKVLRKGVSTWRQETCRKANLREACPPQEIEEPTKLFSDASSSSLEQGLLTEESARAGSDCFWNSVQVTNIAVLCLVWILFFTIQMIKAHAETCGTSYWILNAAQIPVSMLATAAGMWRLSRRPKVMAKSTCWSRDQMIIYPFYAILSGMIGGLLGIGGGMILAPLFLELGIMPQVTSATTTFIVVFSSSMSVVEFYLLGRLPVHYAAYFSLLCALAAIVGLRTTKFFVLKYGRASIIIFLLAFIIAISGFILGLVGGIEEVSQFMAGKSMGFHSLCSHRR